MRTELTQWPARRGRARILLESEDGAVQDTVARILRRAGYDAATCGGPNTLRRRRCQLVAGGDCALSEGADVVVHALNPDHPEYADVLRALRVRHPTTPIVVEVPEPAVRRHADLLAGCEILPMPMTTRTLLQAVEAALLEGKTADCP